MNRTYLNWIIAVVAGLLTIVSFVVVSQGATDEPYFEFHYSDAFTQVVMGTSLITVWCCLSVVVVGLVISRQISSKWLLLLLWSAICIFYLLACPFGYLDDMERNILGVPHS